MPEALTVISVVASVVISVSVYAVLIAVAVDFLKFDRRANAVKEKKSIVATGTMLLFLLGFYLLVRFHVGEMPLPSVVRILSMMIGMALVVLGAVVNIRGRLILKTNWSNH
ncbi:MAG TPA: hypothetical protein VLJ10_03950, partial [Candidatus Bathyarchaeia archaeon]|nr:hypothetical protein [Candidatus Bathyarchaeia archaeon]